MLNAVDDTAKTTLDLIENIRLQMASNKNECVKSCLKFILRIC